MSDREFGGNDDLSLPKGMHTRRDSVIFQAANRVAATVQKIVQDILASEPGMTFAKDSRDLLIECCVEFITLISSEANEIAEKDAKKTIACEHVKAALEELDFGDYVPAILDVAQDYKKQQQVCGLLNWPCARILTRCRTVRRSKPRSSKAA
jgi:histone H3/H4